ncbi:hypothetical protein F444_10292 [Phytophthora nicotianae P1976]|uniref:Uncharacterized protein n=1 Tax=Phytophthora nicotianae P1976 TaxID=1317066 RepID=A0A081A4H4_PHYNI|nr:hypothetical protein F444_10292 [Phytophthora nicotianae P1976]
MMATSYKAARYAGTTVDYNRMAESLHFGTFKGHAEQLQALEKKLVDEMVAALKEQRYLEASKGDDTTKHVHYDLLNDADTALQGSNQLLAPMNQIMGSSSKRDELHDPLVASTGSDKVTDKPAQASDLLTHIQQQHEAETTIQELRCHLLESRRTIDTLRSQLASHNSTRTGILKPKTTRHSDQDYLTSTQVMQCCENAFRAALKVFESYNDNI